MIVDLKRSDLVNLVRSVEPSYDVMDHPMVMKAGEYNWTCGKWFWNKGFEKGMEDKDILMLYYICKTSKPFR